MDKLEIRKFYEVIKNNSDLVELRGIDQKGGIHSGYFTDIDTLLEQVSKYEHLNWYFTLNKINEGCYDRTQKDVITYKPKATTSDSDITKREWILIDLDPKRPSDTNASALEKMLVEDVGNRIYGYLKNVGFANPIVADSANGYHFLYRVMMLNNDENKELVKNFLNAMSMMFSTDQVEVDTSVFNASRICKLYGTYSRKGTNSQERPQRQSKIIRVPEEVKLTPMELIRRVADIIPKPEKPTYKNNYQDSFDIDQFISQHGILVDKDVNVGGVRKILLKECPFDSNHKAPDSAIFVMNNGAIGFKCFHNSCSNHTWQDVRKLYQPQREAWRSTKPTHQIQQNNKPQKEDARGKKFLNLADIEAIDRSKLVTIPSKIEGLDKRIIGFNCGEVSLWTGNNASGKSSLLGQIALNSVQGGFPAVLYSGELKANQVKLWIQQQAAGRQYVLKSNFGDSYYVPKQYVEWIDEWSKEKLKVYNNDYGNKILTMLEDMKEVVDKGFKTIIIDNLMSLDILELEGDKYAKQTGLILKIMDFAKRNDIHIHLVAHPRKSATFLRKTDVSGTADLTNAVDNVFIVHRVNNDFRLHAKEFLTPMVAEEFYKFGNVIEVCKNRDLGVMDFLVGLYFEMESRRFLNFPYENIVYDWMPKQEELKYISANEDFDDLPI